MLVYIKLLRRRDDLRAALRRDGWRLVCVGRSVVASHPQAKAEEAARQRLARLGLLDSPDVRVDFGASEGRQD
jgi:hypothetical protein